MFTGKLIRLREYRKEDAPLALKYVNDFDIKKYLAPGIVSLLTLQEEEKWVESQTSNSDGTYNFAIESLEDGTYIGGCGINSVDWKNSVARVGIFIGDKNYQSKGYGTDAMRVLIRYIFDEMNVHKVTLDVYGFNERAIKCYKKVGFKTEGILRQENFRFGKYNDVHVMGLFKDEFIDD